MFTGSVAQPLLAYCKNDYASRLAEMKKRNAYSVDLVQNLL
jgi:hypothetical protein